MKEMDLVPDALIRGSSWWAYNSDSNSIIDSSRSNSSSSNSNNNSSSNKSFKPLGENPTASWTNFAKPKKENVLVPLDFPAIT